MQLIIQYTTFSDCKRDTRTAFTVSDKQQPHMMCTLVELRFFSFICSQSAVFNLQSAVCKCHTLILIAMISICNQQSAVCKCRTLIIFAMISIFNLIIFTMISICNLQILQSAMTHRLYLCTYSRIIIFLNVTFTVV